jgi:hypothetical protein
MTKDEAIEKARQFCDEREDETGSIGSIYEVMADFLLSQQSDREDVDAAWFTMKREWDKQGFQPGAFTAFKAGLRYKALKDEAAADRREG